MGPTTTQVPNTRLANLFAMACMVLLWLFCTVSAFASDDDDDEHHADKQPQLSFPYATDFEKAPPGTPPPQAVWSTTGYWQIYRATEQQPANSGNTFLNSNPRSLSIPAKPGHEKDKEKDDDIGKTHIAALKRYIAIPTTSKNPMLRFWHRPNIPVGTTVDVQIKMRGVTLKEKDREWTTLISYSNANNANAYQQQLIPLDGYIGTAIRIRFVTHINRGQPALKWWIDDVLIGESGDQDGDGIADDKDLDRDGDGISNEWEIIAGTNPDDKRSVPPDMDHDGIPDAFDPDRDGDGVLNNVDAFPDDPSEWSDLDHDGIGDNKDTDRDGDGISNEYEVLVGTLPDDPTSVPLDANHNGIPDVLEIKDRDNDGVLDDKDAFPDDPTEWSDLDGDGIGDNKDSDRDGDGIDNDYEIQLGFDPNDANSVPPDLDKDGIPDVIDDDRDGDNVPNGSDVFPDNPREWNDTDGDGVGDNADPDRDGDGISNVYEVQLGFNPDDPFNTPPDLDKDGIPDALDGDRDGDGVANEADAFPDDATEWADLDNDGIGDNKDTDRDGDGISNDDEIKLGFNPDDPLSAPPDLDHDSIPDALDPDRDGDGVANEQDLYPDDGSRSALTPVLNVTAQAAGSAVNVQWDWPADTSSVVGYNVYRNIFGQAATKLTPAPIVSAQYIDTDVANGTGYEYRITAVDILNHESEISAPAQVFVAYNDQQMNLSAQRQGATVNVAWNSVVNARYNIYRATWSPPSTFLTTVTSNNYVDDNNEWMYYSYYAVTSILTFTNPFTQQSVDVESAQSNVVYVPELPAFSAQWTTAGATSDPAAVIILNKTAINNKTVSATGRYLNASGPVQITAVGNTETLTQKSTDGTFRFSFPAENSFWMVTLQEIDPPQRSFLLVMGMINDTTPPTININGSNTRVESSNSVIVTGNVNDDWASTFTGSARNNRSGATSFGVVWNTAGDFSVEVPVSIGDNAITIDIADPSGNVATAQVNVNRPPEQVPTLTITSPSNGAVVTTNRITVSGVALSSLPPEQIQLTLNGAVSFPQATSTPQSYQFTFSDVALSAGVNVLTINAITSAGNTQATVSIMNQQDTAPKKVAPPVISITSPIPGSSVTDNNIVIRGTVTMAAGFGRLLINGGEAPLNMTNDPQQRSFSYPIDFSAYGATELIIFFIATDANNQTSTVDFPIKRDVIAPTIELTTPGLSLAPTITTVRETPYVIAGTITDEDLAGFSINDQPISLLPVSYNQFSFSIGVDVPSGTAQSYRFLAWDRALNQTAREVSLQSSSAARIDVVAPTDGKVFEAQQATVVIDVTARAYGVPADGTVEVVIDQQAPQTIALSGTTLNTRVTVDATSQDHTLVLRALDAAQSVLTTRTLHFKTNNPASAPLALTEIKPANGAQFVEPNEFLTISFNRVIDLSKLTVEVRETFHGQTWNLGDQQGVDPISAADQAKLIDVHRDQELVPGAATLLPGNQEVAYRYGRELAYGAQVYVTVGYDGNEMLRTHYSVRTLPTFLQGNVADQFSQPVSGIDVSLPELSRHVVTDANGMYSFGVGDRGDQALSAGRQRIVFNSALQNHQYGTLENWVTIQAGRVAKVAETRLPVLDREIPFQHIVSGANNTLAGNELTLDLTNAHLLFPDGADQGDVHLQFMPREQIGYRSVKHANPQWLYQLQPTGIKVTGRVALTMSVPALRGRLDYLPANDKRLVLVAFDAATKLLLPVGVGKVEQGRIVNTTPLPMVRLDYVGYATVVDSLQPLLQRYERGEISLDELRAGLELGQ